MAHITTLRVPMTGDDCSREFLGIAEHVGSPAVGAAKVIKAATP